MHDATAKLNERLNSLRELAPLVQDDPGMKQESASTRWSRKRGTINLSKSKSWIDMVAHARSRFMTFKRKVKPGPRLQHQQSTVQPGANPTETSHTFVEVMDNLNKQLIANMYSLNGEPTFAPRRMAHELFRGHPNEIKQLYISAARQAYDRASRPHTSSVFYDAILGSLDDLAEDENDWSGSGLSDLLASLIWQRVPSNSDTWQRFELICTKKIDPKPGRPLKDALLPLPREEIQLYLGTERHATDIFNSQYIFRPHILRKDDLGDSVNYFPAIDEKVKLPYVDPEEPCGDGSFGTVFKVKIAKGHMESRNSLNKRSIPLARKDYSVSALAKQSAEYETKIYQCFIRGSVTRHTHVMKPVAGLRQGDRISIFFHQASCDLWDYMKERQVPVEPQDKLEIFGRFIHLASALEYLHNGLQTSGYGRVTCYHLDLKPQNILVVDDPILGETFKITDFGISRIHWHENMHTKKLKYDNKNKTFVTGSVDSYDQADSLRNTRTRSLLGDVSPYISPEAIAEERRGTSGSDVWAFGCILCTILCWFCCGWKGVEDFAESRKSHGGRDYFFHSKSLDASTSDPSVYTNQVIQDDGPPLAKCYSINPAVEGLFSADQEYLEQLGRWPGSSEICLFRQTAKLLSEHLLQVHPDKRQIRMDQVREELVAINGRVTALPQGARL
jgi:serine/threonine protein kinase